MSLKNWILAGAGFLVLLALAAFLLKPSPPPPIKLPNPNGYDDLVKAGQILHGSTPICFGTVEDKWWDDECLAESRAYLKANSEALKLARLGLNRESRIPTLYTQAYNATHNSELSGMKQLAQTLSAEGKIAELENRVDDAIQSYLDAARLSEKMRGGVLIDSMVAISMEALGVNSLQKLSSGMTQDQRERVIKTLTGLYSNRDSFDEIMVREKAYFGRMTSLREKFTVLVMYRPRRAIQKFEMKLKFGRTRLGLFFTDLAVKNFESDKGHAPKTLQELVPEYLMFLPKDDFSGKDFIYRPLTNGYELYGVGPDGKDDGGKPIVLKGDVWPGDMLPNSGY